MSLTAPAELNGGATAPAGSLSERLTQIRKDRERKRGSIITIPVEGTDGLLAASYRRLSFEEKSDIAKRHDGIGTDGSDEVAAAADLLINACQDLLEVVGKDADGKPEYRSLGKRWTTTTISELFGIELPENATVRQAMRDAFDSEDLMDHMLTYIRLANDLTKDDSGELPGESKPSAEG